MFKKVVNCRDIWVGEKKGFIVDGIPVLIINTELGVRAYPNRCPHAGALLSEGDMKGHVLTCARHGWQFEVCTGKGINPQETQLKPYPIMIDEVGDIWIDIENGK